MIAPPLGRRFGPTSYANRQGYGTHLAHGHTLALRRRLFAPYGFVQGLPSLPPVA